MRPAPVNAATTDSNITSPSLLPSADSQARSGCGISPTMFRPALQMPAMLLTEPFGLASAVTSPAAVAYRNTTWRFASSAATHLRFGEVVAFAVRDRDAQHLPGRAERGERRVGLLDAQVHVLAAELQPGVPQHRARQQAGLEQDLEAVADAEHRAALLRRTRARRPSPARTARWRRCGGSRRARSRRAG